MIFNKRLPQLCTACGYVNSCCSFLALVCPPQKKMSQSRVFLEIATLFYRRLAMGKWY